MATKRLNYFLMETGLDKDSEPLTLKDDLEMLKHSGKESKEEVTEPENVITGSASFVSTSLNLLKSIIGAGILGIPLAIKRLGYVPGMLVMILAASLSIFGLYLLSVIIERSGRSSTFSSAAMRYYPKGAVALDLAIIIKCLGVGMSYVSVVGDVIPDIIRGFNPGLIERQKWLQMKVIWVWLTILVMSPIVSMRKIDSLKYTSFFGMAAVVYLLGISIYQMATVPELQRIDAFSPFTLTAFTSFSIFVFAFTCHQNIFPIQNEAKDHSAAGTLRVILLSVGLSLVTYSSFGIFSCAANADIKDKILSSYPIDKLPFIFARIWYAVLLAFSFPLQSYPTRASLQKVASHALGEERARGKSAVIYWTSTIFILAVCGTVASLPVSLDTFLTIVGSTASPVICYFLPALLYLKVTKDDDIKSRPNKVLRICAKVLLGCSIGIIILSSVIVVVKLSLRK